MLKFDDGGWLPLLGAAVVYLLMTRQEGRRFNRVLHERNLLVTFARPEVPYVTLGRTRGN